jgi:diguanylate cyclase (GGDEF)-like protein
VPRLALRFVLWTALGLTATAAVVFVLVRHELTLQAERDAISRAEITAHAVLGNGLRPTDLNGPITPARRRQLDALFRREVLVGGTVRASLSGLDGTIHYSTDHSLIGHATGTPSGGAGAVPVKVVSHIVDGGPRLGRTLESTIPLAVAGRVGGTAQLEQRYGPIDAAARRTSLEIAGIVEVLFLLLLAALLPALNRASARIGRDVDELDRLATHDALLGLPNRVGFSRSFDRLAGREGSLLLLDLDAFREVNDTLGADWGNVLLMRWAERLEADELGCDLIGRLGENELGILSSSVEPGELEALNERIARAVLEPVEIDGIRIALDATTGVVLLPEQGRDFDVVLRRAGLALEHAKAVGERMAIYDSSYDATDGTHLRRTAELRDALERGEFTVYYQPQADLGTRAVRGVEALVRWEHPRDGLLDAGRFIGTAQRSGLITELDRFVLQTMARQWRAWCNLGIEIDVSANLAPVDLLDTGLPDQIAALLESNGLPASRLVLEITEVALVPDDQRTRDVLTRLHELGVRLSIDDYGTGYSSLAYLRRLPVQQVKLDRSFISALPHSAADRAIVRSTTELAHTLGATVVAEGIETHEQWDAAARQGCDIAQGFLIARALSPEKMTELLVADRLMPTPMPPARDTKAEIALVPAPQIA